MYCKQRTTVRVSKEAEYQHDPRYRNNKYKTMDQSVLNFVDWTISCSWKRCSTLTISVSLPKMKDISNTHKSQWIKFKKVIYRRESND